MSESFAVVVPARYGSERFPAKVLADLGGLPLVAHVQGDRMTERALAAGVDVLAHAPWTERLSDDVQRWADDNDFYGSFEEYGDVMGPEAPDDW